MITRLLTRFRCSRRLSIKFLLLSTILAVYCGYYVMFSTHAHHRYITFVHPDVQTTRGPTVLRVMPKADNYDLPHKTNRTQAVSIHNHINIRSLAAEGGRFAC